MKRGDFLQKWGLSSLKLSLGFLEGQFAPSDPDKAAVRELDVERLTRSTMESLPMEQGAKKNQAHPRVPPQARSLQRVRPILATWRE